MATHETNTTDTHTRAVAILRVWEAAHRYDYMTLPALHAALGDDAPALADWAAFCVAGRRAGLWTLRPWTQAACRLPAGDRAYLVEYGREQRYYVNLR